MSTTVNPTPGHAPGHAADHAHADLTAPVTYGLLAEFGTGDAMTHAIERAVAAGYTRLDGFSPYPVGAAADALKFHKSEMGPVMFIGGVTGLCAGFIMQYWANTWGYALNVGGRPYFSWPSFIPITFEMMVLTTALTGFFGLLAICTSRGTTTRCSTRGRSTGRRGTGSSCVSRRPTRSTIRPPRGPL